MNESHRPTSDSAPTRRTPPGPESGIDAFGEILAFRRFLMPVLIQLVFWAGTIASLVWGIGLIEAADRGWQGTSTTMVWAGLGVIVLGPALLRISGELVMVVFRIHELLAKSNSPDG